MSSLPKQCSRMAAQAAGQRLRSQASTHADRQGCLLCKCLIHAVGLCSEMWTAETVNCTGASVQEAGWQA